MLKDGYANFFRNHPDLCEPSFGKREREREREIDREREREREREICV